MRRRIQDLRQMVRWFIAGRHSTLRSRERRATDSQTYPSLSVLMPFFRKVDAFRRILPLNLPYLRKANIEVVVAVDAPEDVDEVAQIVAATPGVCWRVLGCREAHEWRPPCKAINVALRHAQGDFVLVVSPETAFVGDVPSQLLVHLEAFPDMAICGRLDYATFRDLEVCRDVYEVMLQARYGSGLSAEIGPHFYGTIAVARRSAIEIGGFDECFDEWGGDDDNFRNRLELAGIRVLRTPDVNVVHFDTEPRVSRWRRRTLEELNRIRFPASPRCPACSSNWGRAFREIVHDHGSTTSASLERP